MDLNTLHFLGAPHLSSRSWLKFWEVRLAGPLELMPTMILLDLKLRAFQ